MQHILCDRLDLPRLVGLITTGVLPFVLIAISIKRLGTFLFIEAI